VCEALLSPLSEFCQSKLVIRTCKNEKEEDEH
jgi:hypothetical protein